MTVSEEVLKGVGTYTARSSSQENVHGKESERASDNELANVGR